jgi:hypothetical protein
MNLQKETLELRCSLASLELGKKKEVYQGTLPFKFNSDTINIPDFVSKQGWR